VALSIKISKKKTGGGLDMIASRSWPQSKITIGRGEECTLVLEDPRKHVSRVHVELEERDETSFHLLVASKVNPVFINGKRQPPGAKLDLLAGDKFELGEYEIELLAPATPAKTEPQVLDIEETTRPNAPALQVLKAAAAAAPAANKPAPKLEPEMSEEATFIGKPVPKAPPPPAAAPEPAHDAHPEIDHASLPPVEEGLFDDEPTLAPAAAAAPAPAPAAPAPAPAPVTMAAPQPAPAPAKEKDSTDVFAEATFVGASSGAAPAGNIFDEATYVGGRPSASVVGNSDAALRAAIQAFLEGAGLTGKDVKPAEADEFLRQSGKIVRAAVEGAMALLAARATAKKELRAEERTMVASRDNNPLKLMSDPQEVLGYLFETKEPAGGFLDPVTAVNDAFEDLRAHEVALFAAMRAALMGAIQRFDPKTLEAELEKGAGSLGLNRKAKLWELFAAYQQKLARDADDDFNKVFGREFMGTYMAQVKRLKGGGR
jgi:type VI secretion system protein